MGQCEAGTFKARRCKNAGVTRVSVQSDLGCREEVTACLCDVHHGQLVKNKRVPLERPLPYYPGTFMRWFRV